MVSNFFQIKETMMTLLELLASTVPIFSLSSCQVPVEDQVAPKSIKDRFFGSGVTRSGEVVADPIETRSPDLVTLDL